jgi:isocitrate lyase
MTTRAQQIAALQSDWDSNPRWQGVQRHHSAADVVRLRNSPGTEHTLASRGAGYLWNLLDKSAYVHALGATSGAQAVQQVRAGLKAVYLGGERLSARLPGEGWEPLLRGINAALQQREAVEAFGCVAPVVADAGDDERGTPYQRMQAMIAAGAAGVHFDDRRAPTRHGAMLLVPVPEMVDTLCAARLAADVMGVPTLVIARTDACAAHAGIAQAVARALAYAPFADLLWCETGKPDLAYAQQFAQAVHARFPGKMLAYNCSPSFDWKRHLDDATIARFQKALGAMGYKFQFTTLAGLPLPDEGMATLAQSYARRGMAALADLQEMALGA